jgi:hypothetical protein
MLVVMAYSRATIVRCKDGRAALKPTSGVNIVGEWNIVDPGEFRPSAKVNISPSLIRHGS